MANVSVGLTTLSANTFSSDMRTTAGTAVTVDSGNTAVIAAPGGGYRLIIFAENNSTADVSALCTIQAGDKPPAEGAGRGNTALTEFGQNELRAVTIDMSRHSQSDGTIEIAVTDSTSTAVVADVRFTALRIGRDV